MGRLVDFSLIITLAVFIIVLGAIGIYYLMGWTFVHDKLRAERKEDSKEGHG